MIAFTPELLAEARKLSGLTLLELAQLAEISHGQVVRFESGLRPGAESWQKILAVLRGALVVRVRDAARMAKRLAP
jgi:transcriptional regulator with XRE-family HTH domain